jgi:hypothetical protein
MDPSISWIKPVDFINLSLDRAWQVLSNEMALGLAFKNEGIDNLNFLKKR